MRKLHYHILAAMLVTVALVAADTTARGASVTSGDFCLESSAIPIVSGSGRLDIILFTGDAVPNPIGMPAANSGMPGGGSTFVGDYPLPGDPETMTVGEVLDWLHANRGPGFNVLEVEIDFNEPGAVKKQPLTIDQFTIGIGATTFSTANPIMLDAPDNGSGYSDFVIRGLGGGIDLTVFNPMDLITFHLEASDLDGGYEEFFISGGGDETPVPEPATMGLLGLGLGFMAARRRLR